MVADINSILIYFGALIITLIFLHYFSNAKTQNRFVIFLGVLITALPLSLIAGLRDPSVGTDTSDYMVIFNSIYKSSLVECFSEIEIEKGFVLLVKILSILLGEDNSIIFFALEYVSLIVLIYALLNIKDKLNPCLVFFLYFLVFYHCSLNIVRQGLSMSLIILMIVKLVDKKYIQSILVLLISSCIHISSVIVILFIFAAVWLKNYRNLPSKRFFYVLSLVTLMIFFYFCWEDIVTLPIFSSYDKYLKDDYSLGLGIFITGSIYFIIPLTLFKSEIFSEYDTEVLFNIAAMYIPIASLGYFARYASRLNLYPKIAIVLFASHLIHKVKNPSERKFLLCSYLFLFIWEYVRYYMILNQTEAYPYLFNI